MSNLQFHFEYPLLFLLLIPLIALTFIPYFRMNKRYRRTRNRVISMILHLTVSLLAVLALVGTNITYDVPNSENEMILLVDSSYSGKATTDAKADFIESIVEQANGEFKIGLVAFGYNAYEVVGLTNSVSALSNKYAEFMNGEDAGNNRIDNTATDIGGALTFALDKLSHPESAKIVVLTDGIETDGAAQAAIRAVNAAGTKVDAVYFGNEEEPEVQIVGVTIPEEGIAINSEISLQIAFESRERCSVNLEIVDDQNISPDYTPKEIPLAKGSQSVNVAFKLNDVYGIHHLTFSISYDGMYDTETENNTYHSYIEIPSFNRILMLERYSGESDKLYDIITKADIDSSLENAFPDYEVDRINIATEADRIPTTIEQFCEYHEVILVNVSDQDLMGVNDPKSADDLGGVPDGLDTLLVDYVQKYGGNLFVVGGVDPLRGSTDKPIAHVFNPCDDASDDYYNTFNRSKKFRDMLPVEAVDYSLPKGVVLLVDRSKSMCDAEYYSNSEGKPVNSLSLAREGAKSLVDEIVNTTGYQDYLGIIQMARNAETKLPPTVATMANRDAAYKAIDSIEDLDIAGTLTEGITYFYFGIEEGLQMLDNMNVEKKHLIILTDGKPFDSVDDADAIPEGSMIPSPYGELVQRKRGDVQVHVVLISDTTDTKHEEDMEEMTKLVQCCLPTDQSGSASNYIHLVNTHEINSEAAYQKVLGDVTSKFRDALGGSLVESIKYEDYTPLIVDHKGVASGISQSLMPTLSGYFGTRPKTGSNTQIKAQYVPLYSNWTYGKGKVGAFMCPLDGKTWSTKFVDDSYGQRIIMQIIGSLMPTKDIALKDIDARVSDMNYTTQVNIYTSLEDGQSLRVNVTGPTDSNGLNAYTKTINISGDASSYRAEFESRNKGLYNILIEKLDSSGNVIGEKSLTKYKAFSYSAEYDEFVNSDERVAFLNDLVDKANHGKLIEAPEEAFLEFEASLHREFDPRVLFMILAIVLFLLDLAVRKFKFKWIHEIVRERKENKQAQDK